MVLLSYAKVLIFNDKGQVLLIQRSEQDEGRPGEPDYPGGGVEPGEDIIAATVREIKEETNLDVPFGDLKLFYGHTEKYSNRSTTRLMFFARLSGEQKVTLSFEHTAYVWIDPARALREFAHPVWGAALEYGLKHKLFELS